MAMTTVSLHLDSQMVSLHLGKLKGYVHRMDLPTEIRWALPTDSRMGMPMGCLRTVKPMVTRTGYHWVK